MIQKTDTPGGVSIQNRREAYGQTNQKIQSDRPIQLQSKRCLFHYHLHPEQAADLVEYICRDTPPGVPQPQNPGSTGHPGTGVPTVELLWHGAIADKYIQQMKAFYDDLSVDQYVIMPDHIHLLISIHNGEDTPEKRTSRIARFIGTFKRFCNKEYGENIWQGRFHDHVIRNQQDYDETWEYIANNPRKWAITRHILE